MPETSDQLVPMDLHTLQAMVLRSNTDVLVRQQDVSLAREQIGIERAAFDPNFFGRWNGQRGATPSAQSSERPLGPKNTGDAQFAIAKRTQRGTRVELGGNYQMLRSESTGSLLNPEHQTYGYLSVTKPLLRGAGLFYNRGNIILASQFQEITDQRWQRLVLERLQEAEALYWQFFLRHENWRDLDAIFALADQLEQYAKLSFEKGLTSELEYARARAVVASRKMRLLDAANQAILAENDLKAISNHQDATVGPTEVWIPRERPVVLQTEFVPEDEIFTGLQNRSDFQAAIVSLQRQKVQVELAKRNLRPFLDLEAGLSSRSLGGGDAEVRDSDGNPVLSPYLGSIGDALQRMTWRDGAVWNVGVIVRFPYAYREERSIVRQRLAVVRQEMETMIRIERNIIREVRTALRLIENGFLRVEQARIQREMTQTVYDKVFEAMKLGEADIKRVVDALDELAEAKIEENRAVTEYIQYLTGLERANGTYLTNRGFSLAELP